MKLSDLSKITLLILLLNFVFVNCSQRSEKLQDKVVEMIEEVDSTMTEPTLFYGYEVDSFDIVEGKIKWNQTLSSLLDDYNISTEQVYQIANAAREVYDVRKLKAGNTFNLIVSRDSSRTARQFIFEPDPFKYVVYNFADSVYARVVEKEVKHVERTVAAEINNSVWQTVVDAGAPPVLVSKLVDILAWQVSFFHIMKGDKFKVIYDEEQVEGVAVGIKKIKAVHFYHNGKDYYGIQYNQGTDSDYFDEEGNSLRKTFLRAPLVYNRISSRYSPRRYHPVLKRYKSHLGTDYAAPPGTPIKSVGEGVVVEAQYSKYNGNYVKVRHNANYTTQYLHMSKIKSGIRPGVSIEQGQIIGFVGSTGLATGPHLCFRFWKNGRQVDALSVDLPPTEPIKPEVLSDYLHTKNYMMHRLANVGFPEKKVLMAKVGSQQ